MRHPSSDDTATIGCPVCGHMFAPSGRRRYCSDTCRRTAWARRHRPRNLPLTVPPAGQPRRPVTVYECVECGSQRLGEQRCEDCATFMRRVGIGGQCPHCNEPVVVDDLLEQSPTIGRAAPVGPKATTAT